MLVGNPLGLLGHRFTMFPDTENHQEVFDNTRRQNKYCHAPFHDSLSLKLGQQQQTAIVSRGQGAGGVCRREGPERKKMQPRGKLHQESYFHPNQEPLRGRSHILSFPEYSAARVLASQLQMLIQCLVGDLIN